MDIPSQLAKELLKKYKASSIKAFTINIKRLLKELYNRKIYEPKYLYNTIKVKKYILNDLPKLSVQKNMTASILAFLKADRDTPQEVLNQYQTLFKSLVKQADQSFKYKPASLTEEENWIPFSNVKTLQKKYQELTSDYDFSKPFTYHQKQMYQRYLTLSLYTQIPPLRGEEYTNAIIVSVSSPKLYDCLTKATQKNIMDIKHNKFVSAFYKTDSKYGTRIIDVPQSLIKIVRTWFQITGNQNLLLNLQTNQPFTQQGFTAFLNRIFEPNRISTSMLRKIYISDKLKTLRDPAKRKKLAHIMGHSLETQEFIYTRFKNV
jgi:hypothetical protein